MKFPPETLMAYVDGELDAETRRAVEAAMATDEAVAREVQRHMALRSELRATFDGVLNEPVPSRLIDTANSSPTASSGEVTDLAAVRARKTVSAQPQRWSWPQWTAIAASLLIAVFAGRFALQAPESALVATREGQLVASGALASALSEQRGGESADAVNIGLSFRAKSGEYCRTFTTQKATPMAGLACREAQAWRIHTLAQSGSESTDGYRMAGSALPAPILQAVEATIAGEPLDAEQEAAARARNWKP